MIDTHTHLYMPEFEGGATAVEAALEAGVRHMVLPNVDVASVEPMLALHRLRPDVTSVALGLHPTETDSSWRDRLDEILQAGSDVRPVAIGEVGMDLYWDRTYMRQQQEAFEAQLWLAAERGLPVIVHCREALEPTLDVVRALGSRAPRMVFHSFTLGPDEVKRVRRVTDAFFGINGVVTFKNAAPLRSAIPEIGVGRLLLETDSPYLAPVPHRGKRNESAWIPEVCRGVAAALGAEPEEVSAATDAAACELFDLNLT